MDTTEFFAAVKLLEKEKGISADILCDRIAAAMTSSIKGSNCVIDPEKETIKIFIRKNVVSEIVDPSSDILPEAAERYKAGAIPGDIVEIPLDTKDFSRITASTAKNVIRQGIREAERSQLKQDYQSKHNELVTVKVVNIDKETGNATVEMGRGECVLTRSEQVPGEILHIGDLIKVYVVDIKESEKSDVRVVISRRHQGLVRRLFEEEIPEIFDGTVEIKGVSREPGARTKVAVYSADENVDAVGSCIGAKGARVAKIVDLLGGEKIDIIKYSDKPEEFVAAALAPADVLEVEVLDEQARSCSVTVPDDQLSLAIGNKGQNARLAARLTGWKIDIKPESGFFEIPEK